MLRKTCLNRFLGRCQGCIEDYNEGHHPNNYDCRDYKEIKIITHEIGIDSRLEKEVKLNKELIYK